MIERYISVKENGEGYARIKACRLRDENGYKILKIEHTWVPKWGSAIPDQPTYGQTEEGYLITVETTGYIPGENHDIPNIIENL